MASFPNLFYPEMYLLEGGYKAFYAAHPALCDGGYQEMEDAHFVAQLAAAEVPFVFFFCFSVVVVVVVVFFETRIKLGNVVVVWWGGC